MSSHIKKEKEQPIRREEKADFLFNQHIVRTVAYTAAGFGVGMLASLLFKHKAGMTLFFAGTGAGYGGANFINDLSVFRRNRNWLGPNQTQTQGQSQDQRRFERRDDTLGQGAQKIKENVKEGAEDVSRFMSNKVNQAARGVDEVGRDLADKAKKFSRGGDDDSSDKKKTEQKRDDKISKDKNETKNVKGQTFQSFESNPLKAGEKRSAPVDFEKNRAQQQDVAKDINKENQKRQIRGLEQERGGVDSVKKVENVRLPNDPSSPADYEKRTNTLRAPISNHAQVKAFRDD